MHPEMKAIYDRVVARDPNQPEFHQACLEVLETLGPAIDAHPEYIPIVERICEPERIIQFRVTWVDDDLSVRNIARNESRTTS